MVIAINARVLTERMGGPARYIKNIIRELTLQDSANTYYILVKKEDFDFGFPLPANFNKVILPTDNRVLFDYFYLPLFSWKRKVDIFMFPKNTFSPLVRGRKVPVYHDIIYFEKGLKFREFKLFDDLHHRIMIPIASRFSAVDLTVSEFTASRMRELLKIKPEKIRVIKEGVEGAFRKIEDKKELDRVSRKYDLHYPFFFYSGSLSPRKNMQAVVDAFSRIKKDIPHYIYFTGCDSWNDRGVYFDIDRLQLNGRVKVLGHLTDEELIAMYNLADCYLYPSLYEGFGLPILEAQACGCPLITSDIPSCREVAGDGALIVDPRDVNAIADAMVKVTTDKALRRKLVKKGLANCKQYSWEKTVRELRELMNELS
jgi:glycosyltransferase involved in cell wall biosynthesis